jgi:hypothetical protein
MDFAAMGLGHGAHQRQAEPGALAARGKKRFEQARLRFVRDAGPGV